MNIADGRGLYANKSLRRFKSEAALKVPSESPHSGSQSVGSSIHHDNRGAFLVETAIVLPIFLMMLMGVLLCGMAFYNYLTLTRAVTSSASDLQTGWGSIGASAASPYSDPCTLVSTKAASYALGMDPTNITYTIVLNNTSIYPIASGATPVPTTQGTFACTNALPLKSDTWATVIATYPCNFTFMGFDFLASTGHACNLKAISTVHII